MEDALWRMCYGGCMGHLGIDSYSVSAELCSSPSRQILVLLIIKMEMLRLRKPLIWTQEVAFRTQCQPQ